MAEKRDYSAITPEILALAAHCSQECVIDKQLYTKFKVNRGLRDENGNGVLTGLTEISEIQAKTPDGQPCEGSLFYRGYNVNDLVKGFLKDGRFGFEEITYLLLFGDLPSREELSNFCQLLASYRSLPNSFVRDIIMKAPSTDIMNSVARSVLTLYSYDNNPNDVSIPNVLSQCLQLIAMFPQLVAGPIVRYTDVAPQLQSRTHTVQDAALGARRFVLGLGKKVLLANVLYELVTVYQQSGQKTVLLTWMYAAAYMMHVYFDFSGYSDMAIGLGRIMGFRFAENFNYPFISGSLTE